MKTTWHINKRCTRHKTCTISVRGYLLLIFVDLAQTEADGLVIFHVLSRHGRGATIHQAIREEVLGENGCEGT